MQMKLEKRKFEFVATCMQLAKYNAYHVYKSMYYVIITHYALFMNAV